MNAPAPPTPAAPAWGNPPAPSWGNPQGGGNWGAQAPVAPVYGAPPPPPGPSTWGNPAGPGGYGARPANDANPQQAAYGGGPASGYGQQTGPSQQGFGAQGGYGAAGGYAPPQGGYPPPGPPPPAWEPPDPTKAEEPHIPDSVMHSVEHAGDALKRVGIPAGLVERVINILTRPVHEWQRIAGEASTVQSLYVNYAILLAIIPFVSTLAGTALLCMRYDIMRYMPWGRVTIDVALAFAVQLAGLFALAYIFKTLAPNFGAVSDQLQSLKVVIYASTPIWLLGIMKLLMVFPPLYRLGELIELGGAVYGAYLMWLGVGNVLRPKPDQAVTYTVVGVVCYIVIMGVAMWLAGFGGPSMTRVVTY